MGNCFMKPKKSSAEISPSDQIKPSSPIVKLYGSPSGALTSFIRVAFLYKTAVSLHFVPSEIPNFSSGADSDTPVIQYGSDTVTGTSETMLRYIDGKFPNPPLLKNEGVIPAGIVIAVTLQHRSMLTHLDSMVQWTEDLGVRGKTRAVDPTMGSCGMEMKKFGRSYSQLLEFMLEHAQMEERVVFPVLEKADRGLSRAANEDHSRDLPIMNGIKEDIKSIGVIQAGSPFYQEALNNLSYRLKLLQERCKVHFEEEEKELLPLLEAIELNAEQLDRMVEQCFEVMESTHSHLFSFLILGLLPQDAMQYLSLITRWIKKERVSSMLLPLMKRIESKTPLIGHSTHHSSLN